MNHVSERGVEGLTIAAIAARAGVAETSVYRRWKSPPELIAAAVSDMAETGNPAPDSGSLPGDLEQLAQQIAENLALPGIARLLGAAVAMSADAEVAVNRDRFWEIRFELSSVVIDRGIERGELPAGVNAHDIIETLVAPLYFRVLVTNRPVDSSFIRTIVGHVLALYGCN